MTRRGLLVVCAIAASCTRYELVNELDVPGLCPTSAKAGQPGGPLVVTVTTTLGEVRGQVSRRDSHISVANAQVLILGVDSTFVLTDSSGAFSIAGLRPGKHEMLTRVIGYAMRRDTISIAPGAGLAMTITLQPVTTDGPCSGFAVLAIPKPWWKIW